MDAAALESLRSTVLWAAFAVSSLFGVIAHRTHFCTMGAISDVVHMGDWTRARSWVMAIGVAMLGFNGMAALGWIDPTRTIYHSGRVIWLSAIAGGALFGFGMVLASGCGSKALIRIGGGSLKSLVVFVVMGVAAFATLRGITAVLRDRTVDRIAFDMLPGSALPEWLAAHLGWDPAAAALAVGGGVGVLLIGWAAWDKSFRRSPQAWLAGLGIGATAVAMWWVSGRLGFVAEHPQTLESVFLATNSGRMESLTFAAPMAYTLDWLIYFSDESKVLTLGVVSVLGVVAGAFAHATFSRTFRWEGFAGTRDTALHLVGAVCMGVGGVTAMGCSVGQGLSGISTLSVTSAIALTGIVLGALGGFRFQLWLLEHE
ncbi:MAG: YeeE/YedE family protein [Tepidimonas sp.]|uniref:YeeE/YedE family protein n=1 Tax=Tepidimonas sp. TaxID=2002775 RepID=UPI0040552F3C